MSSLEEERASKPPRAIIPNAILARLRNDIGSRRIGSGIEWLDAHRRLLGSLRPAQVGAAALLGYVAQWVDVGFDHPNLVKELLSRFPQNIRPELSLSEYVHIRMAEGMVAMFEEDYERAIRHFATVLSFENEAVDKEIIAIGSFWTGRCQRRMGRYDSARTHTIKAKEIAQQLGFPKMAAVMRVLESWLVFQDGKPQEARQILKEAEAVLSETDDYMTRGNIQSAYGRIARRQGRYDQALQHFAHSIDEYKKRNGRHRNLARALTNLALVKRLIALRLRRKIDREVARRWKGEGGNSGQATLPKRQDRVHFEKLRQEADAHLTEAERIYALYDDHRGLGTVHIHRGLLCLDGGDLARAGSEAAAAFRLGEDRKDYILEARARTLQATVENAKFEEQIEDKSGLSHRAQLAHDFARDAVECAKHTQNRRLLGRAYIMLGFVLANEYFNDPSGASECCDKAAILFKPEGHDYVWEDLQLLRKKLLKAGRIESSLRQWSHGVIGDKTFQQITEEFAGIVIPKVWKREGRKVSRVAARLSISPKKVRRILAHAGLLDGKGDKH